ncbi:MAG: Maf family nucleotide pyrophosphatase [Bacteroidales bacterium]
MLHKKLQKYRVILASQSPRRRELLKGLDINFELSPFYEIDEAFSLTMPKEEVPIWIAQKKSKSYPKLLNSNQLLLTADTLVWSEDCFLGKPKDAEQAQYMLQKLSGKTHEVLTGVCLRHKEQYHSFFETTRVTFRHLQDDEIIYYIKQYKPYDKAGAYGVQEWLGYTAVERIEGSYQNIMGLPVQKLYVELAKFINAVSAK